MRPSVFSTYSAMPFLRFLYDVARYLALVVGGITLFLIFAPLFGYVPYSDGNASSPKAGWGGVYAYAPRVLSFGAFLALLIAVGGILSVGLIRLAERMHAPVLVIRVGGGLLTAIITAYFVWAGGWFIALPRPAVFLGTVLGLVAGAWLLPLGR